MTAQVNQIQFVKHETAFVRTFQFLFHVFLDIPVEWPFTVYEIKPQVHMIFFTLETI